MLPQEEVFKNEITDIQNKIAFYNKALNEKENLLETIANRKRVITGSGNELESQIQNICGELGFEILEAERNRDDLIVKYKDKIAIIEIKGVTESAKEQYAGQLEKWVALYL